MEGSIYYDNEHTDYGLLLSLQLPKKAGNNPFPNLHMENAHLCN